MTNAKAVTPGLRISYNLDKLLSRDDVVRADIQIHREPTQRSGRFRDPNHLKSVFDLD